jgi:drug/metabolite transporter (DMT)-like permease
VYFAAPKGGRSRLGAVRRRLMSSASSIPRRALVLLVVLTLVWGTNWGLFPLAVREVSVWTFRSVSLLIGGVLLFLVARLRGQPLAIPRQHWRVLLLATFCYLVVWNVASTYSALMIPSGQAAILGFTMPLWSALFSWLWLRERMDGRLLLGIALGAAAVLLLMSRGLGVYAEAPLGFALGLLAGAGWAVGTLILKRGKVPVSATVLTAWQLVLTALPVGAGAMLLGDWQGFIPSWTTILVIAWITLVPMCIGNLAWFAIVGMLPATVAGLSSLMVPVVAMLFGAWFNAEPLGPVQWAAMACSAIALRLTLYRPAAQ